MKVGGGVEAGGGATEEEQRILDSSTFLKMHLQLRSGRQPSSPQRSVLTPNWRRRSFISADPGGDNDPGWMFLVFVRRFWVLLSTCEVT